MSQINLMFPDGNYSEANKPSVTTLQSDLQSIEDTYNAHESDTTVHVADSSALVTLDGTETLTNKTLADPIIEGMISGTAVPPKTFYASNLNIPGGFLINGKIVPSVASNNLTVALKGMDGNDPSETNPVYVRIDGVIRSVTSVLSVTKNAGTNWFNAGSTELAAKEIDYFVYLGYNATDGVVIGFSRIPYAASYSEFNTTTTNEKYCAISTITNAVSNDYYYVIGRFAATLSAGAGYTWSVPSFTSINLIQRPIYETRVLTWLPVSTGFTGSVTYTTSSYQIMGRRISMLVDSTGTSNSTGFTMTPPISITPQYDVISSLDNGTWAYGHILGGSALTLYKAGFGVWTNTGTKGARFSLAMNY